MKHTLPKYGLRKAASKFPMMLVLSFSYVCNARCPNCPYNNSKIRRAYKDARFMSVGVLAEIADQAGPHKAVLRFTGGGEPMLHHSMTSCIKYAKGRGCRTSVITNGSIPVNEILNVADVIEFSVDAGNERDYLKARPGLDWDFLNENIRYARRKSTDTKLIASVINQKGIDVEGAVRYWDQYVDKVQVRKYLTWGLNQDHSADDTPYLPPDKNVPCPWLFERLNIDSRGDVTYCGEDIAFKHKFGNVMATPIEDIWLGPEMQSIRKKHLANKGHEVEMCAACPDWKYRTWTWNYWELTKGDKTK